MNPLLKYSIIILLSLILCCGKKEPIKIGYAGSISGKYSDLGTDGRDGVILAVEEINARGGINGHPVILLTSDDKGDPAEAVKGDKWLISEGVIAIVGHMTSNMTMSVIDIINENRIVMISPTTSTGLLRDKDDYFFRVTCGAWLEAKNTAIQAIEKLKLRKMAIIQDTSNKEYTDHWRTNFKENFESNGGTIDGIVTFSSAKKPSFTSLTSTLLQSSPDGILIVANARDSAMICQQIRKRSKSIKIIICGWAQTSDIIIYGGSSVEGAYFSHWVDLNNKSEVYEGFIKNYTARFNQKPEFASVYGYNAVMVIYDALKRDKNPGHLKDTILEKKTYNGLQGEYIINSFGDAEMTFHLISIKDGNFIGLD